MKCPACGVAGGRGGTVRCRRCSWTFHRKCLGLEPETARMVSSFLCSFCEPCAQCGTEDGSDALLCDGCGRNFHFDCVDPPLRPDQVPAEEPWLCLSCSATVCELCEEVVHSAAPGPCRSCNSQEFCAVCLRHYEHHEEVVVQCGVCALFSHPACNEGVPLDADFACVNCTEVVQKGGNVQAVLAPNAMVQLDGEALTGASAMLISQARTALEKYSLRKGKKQIRLSDKDRKAKLGMGTLSPELKAQLDVAEAFFGTSTFYYARTSDADFELDEEAAPDEEDPTPSRLAHRQMRDLYLEEAREIAESAGLDLTESGDQYLDGFLPPATPTKSPTPRRRKGADDEPGPSRKLRSHRSPSNAGVFDDSFEARYGSFMRPVGELSPQPSTSKADVFNFSPTRDDSFFDS